MAGRETRPLRDIIENACHSERSDEGAKSKNLRTEGQQCRNDNAKSPVAVPSECPRSFDLRPSLTAATRSGRSSRHWRRSHRSPSARRCLAQDDRGRTRYWRTPMVTPTSASLASPFGRGARAEQGRRGPSQSRGSRDSSPRGRAKASSAPTRELGVR